MTNIRNKLESMSDDKLIDIVQNYQQYGYPKDYQEDALNILDDRGIDEMVLRMTGKFENKTFNDAEMTYNSFQKNSKIAFTLYLSSIMLLFAYPFVLPNGIGFSLVVICFFAFLIFLIRSFINQSDFYKLIGKADLTENPIVFFFIGMPFYFFVYLHIRNKMKDQLKIVP